MLIANTDVSFKMLGACKFIQLATLELDF